MLVNTLGHSQGIFTTLVRNNGEYVVLIADTGYMRKSWEKLTLPGLTINRKAALTSFKWIQKLSSDDDCVEILANHDPEVKPHIIEL